MTHEQLAMVNQQLAGMLGSGIPLEGALERLCQDMERGALRTELEALGKDLTSGRPLSEAVQARKLPEFYVRMLQLGAGSQDLPGVLAMLGDYYQRSHLVWTRLSGLMVYPVLVLATASVLSALVALVIQSGMLSTLPEGVVLPGNQAGWVWTMRAWAPSVVFGISTLGVLACVFLKPLRAWARWGVPGFREASLANLAGSLHLMLAKGCPLGDALQLAGGLESGTPAGADLRGWMRRLAEGHGRFVSMAEGSRCVPPLFVWLVGQGGEDLAKGFKRAAELYHQRAVHKIEMLLYLVLPISVLVLGSALVTQILPLVRVLVSQMDNLGGLE